LTHTADNVQPAKF